MTENVWYRVVVDVPEGAGGYPAGPDDDVLLFEALKDANGELEYYLQSWKDDLTNFEQCPDAAKKLVGRIVELSDPSEHPWAFDCAGEVVLADGTFAGSIQKFFGLADRRDVNDMLLLMDRLEYYTAA